MAAFSFGTLAQETPIAGPKWGAHIDLEAKLGSKRSLGEADLFLPVAQDERTLFFANLRARTDDQSSREGNLGVGVRRMLEDGWNLGGYAYFDRRRSSDSGYYYNQATLGAEVLGKNWDFRTNGYLPQGTRVRALGTTGGVSSAAVSGTSILVTTTASMMQEERALKGFDAEVGWRTPLFDSEARHQLRLYAGGYRFADEVMKVEGPRLRAELAMEDLTWFGKGTALFLGAEAQHDNARGDQNFLSVRLRIPLGKESERPSPLNAQERRMAAPVMRDVDIVTRSRSIVLAPPVVESAVATADGTAFTVVSSAMTSGAALPGVVAGLPNNSTILLFGTFNTTASVNLFGNKSLIAGNITVRTPSGYTAVVNAPATISNSNNTNFIIAAPGNNTISGLTIIGTLAGNAGYGIHVNDTAGNVNILNNTITMTQTGANSIIGIGANQQNQNLIISGNTVTVVGTAGWSAIGIRVWGLTGPSSATVSGNTLNVSGGTNNYAVTVDNQTTINSGSTGNVLVSGICNGTPASGSVGFTNGTSCP